MRWRRSSRTTAPGEFASLTCGAIEASLRHHHAGALVAPRLKRACQRRAIPGCSAFTTATLESATRAPDQHEAVVAELRCGAARSPTYARAARGRALRAADAAAAARPARPLRVVEPSPPQPDSATQALGLAVFGSGARCRCARTGPGERFAPLRHHLAHRGGERPAPEVLLLLKEVGLASGTLGQDLQQRADRGACSGTIRRPAPGRGHHARSVLRAAGGIAAMGARRRRRAGRVMLGCSDGKQDGGYLHQRQGTLPRRGRAGAAVRRTSCTPRTACPAGVQRPRCAPCGASGTAERTGGHPELRNHGPMKGPRSAPHRSRAG